MPPTHAVYGIPQARARRARTVAGATAAALLLAGFAAPPASADGKRRVSEFDAEIEVTSGGEVRVRETLTYTFGADSGRVERTIPHTGSIDGVGELDFGLTGVEVEDADGAEPVEVREDGDETAVLIGGDSRLTGSKTFVIDYTYTRLVFYGPSDPEPRLFLDVVGGGWGIPVEDVRARVAAPGEVLDDACYAGPEGSTAECDDRSAGTAGAVFEHGRVRPGEFMTIDLALEPGSLEVPDAKEVPVPDTDDSDDTDWFGWIAWFGSGLDMVKQIVIIVVAGILIVAALRGRTSRTGGGGPGHGGPRRRRPSRGFSSGGGLSRGGGSSGGGGRGGGRGAGGGGGGGGGR